MPKNSTVNFVLMSWGQILPDKRLGYFRQSVEEVIQDADKVIECLFG